MSVVVIVATVELMLLLLLTGFVVICNVFLGLAAFKKNPNSTTNILFLVLTLIVALWSVANYFSLVSVNSTTILLWIRIDMVITAVMFPTIFLLSQSFPSRTLGLSKIWAALIGIWTLLIGLMSMTPLVFKGLEMVKGEVSPVPGMGIPFFAIHVIGFLGWSLITLFKKYKLAHGIEKLQLRFFILGIAVTFILGTLTNFVLVNLLHVTSLVALGPILSLILIFAISYSILRHKFLDISLLITRTVSYTILILVVAAIYSLSFLLIGNIALGIRLTVLQQVVLVVLTLFVTLSFHSVQNVIQGITGKFLFKNNYNSDDVLNELSKTMASTLIMDDLCHGILQTLLQKVHISKGAFILLTDNKIAAVKYEKYVNAPVFDEEEIRQLSNTRDAVNFDNLDDLNLKNILRNLDLSLVIHLRTEGQQIGLLVLGQKESGDVYSEQDLDLLSIVAHEAAVAIQNAQSYEEIRRFNITLQDEVDKATVDLQDANDKLKLLDKLKDEFVSVASHELRTPMTAIKSYTWMVLNDKVGPIEPKVREYLGRVYESTERLLHLVNEMLDISRIEGGRVQLKLSPVNLVDLANKVQNDFQARATEQKLTVEVTADEQVPLVQIDEEKIHQVLENLVGNSFKFTPEGGKVTMHIANIENGVRVDVTDTGKGIKPEDIDKLFTKFGRLEGSLVLMNSNSTGLGLYICKQYVEMHKGKIWVISEVDKGTTVSFTFPLT